MKKTFAYTFVSLAIISSAVMLVTSHFYHQQEVSVEANESLTSTGYSAKNTPLVAAESNKSTISHSAEEVEQSTGSDDRASNSPGEDLEELNDVDNSLFKELDFVMALNIADNYTVDGVATSNIGDVIFSSQLTPTNEVVLSVNLTQSSDDVIELRAYFDLANYKMELDGSNAVLNKAHKQLMEALMYQLGSRVDAQFRNYDFPEHALMLLQMLSYWSVSPEGYVHEKRKIVANY